MLLVVTDCFICQLMMFTLGSVQCTISVKIIFFNHIRCYRLLEPSLCVITNNRGVARLVLLVLALGPREVLSPQKTRASSAYHSNNPYYHPMFNLNQYIQLQAGPPGIARKIK